MTDLKDSNNNDPLPGQTNILDVIEERKQWNRTIANFDDTIEKCEYCGGPKEEKQVIDPVNGVDYYLVCKNPDCPLNN
jgi:hypothetical protein